MAYLPSFPRLHTLVSLALNTARTPSATKDTEVIITIHMVVGLLQTATAVIQIDNSGGGAFTTIATISTNLASTVDAPIKFTCPPTSQYKVVGSGTGTTTMTIYELTKPGF